MKSYVVDKKVKKKSKRSLLGWGLPVLSSITEAPESLSDPVVSKKHHYEIQCKLISF